MRTKLILLLLLLFASAAAAQPQMTRGGALKRRAYQTYSTITLYVDPTGSNENPCTSSAIDSTTGFAARYGATVMLNGYTPTFSNVTNELDVDGVSFTHAFLSTLSPSSIIGSSGSTLFK